MNWTKRLLQDYKGPYLFWIWICPHGCRGNVTWHVIRHQWWAKCQSCGKTSKLQRPRPS